MVHGSCSCTSIGASTPFNGFVLLARRHADEVFHADYKQCNSPYPSLRSFYSEKNPGAAESNFLVWIVAETVVDLPQKKPD
jgi:hypothetical protein